MDSKIKILVVDDDESILDVLWHILQQAGYDVKLLSDGKEIMSGLKELPAIILLDNKLSGIEGTFICQYLKSNPETSYIPIILISAVHDIKEKYKIAGADDYIEKPFSIDYLLNKIKVNLTKSSH